MPKFQKKPIIVEAVQWHKLGDHEGVTKYPVHFLRENVCDYCQQVLEVHGWVKILEGGHIVCPSDWIITGIHGEFYPCKNDIFFKTYDEVKE